MTRRRKLMVFTYYFPPCGGVAVYRMLAFARHLPEFGWDVSFLAAENVPFEPVDETLLKSVPAGTRVVRVPLPRNWWTRTVGRYSPLENWLGPAWAAAQPALREQRPDVVLSTSPPGCVHMLGLWAKTRFGVPWAACFRDPWITNLQVYRRSWLRKILETRGERRTFANADLILANTPLNLEGFARAFPDRADRIICVPNGFDPEEGEGEGSAAGQSPAPAARSKLVLLHAGEIYIDRDPRPLLDALCELRRTAGMPDLRLEFLGQVTREGLDLPLEIKRRGLEDVARWRNQVPYPMARQAMKEADILVVLAGPAQRISVPAKVYEYLGLGKPILALAEPGGDVERVLRAVEVSHRVAPAGDAAAIRRAVAELATEVSQGKARPADRDKLRSYTRREIMRGLAQRLDALVGS